MNKIEPRKPNLNKPNYPLKILCLKSGVVKITWKHAYRYLNTSIVLGKTKFHKPG